MKDLWRRLMPEPGGWASTPLPRGESPLPAPQPRVAAPCPPAPHCWQQRPASPSTRRKEPSKAKPRYLHKLGYCRDKGTSSTFPREAFAGSSMPQVCMAKYKNRLSLHLMWYFTELERHGMLLPQLSSNKMELGKGLMYALSYAGQLCL